MQATILSIGDELALGQTVDTNTAHLASRLAAIGIPCAYHVTVADDLEAITRTIRRAAEESQLVLISGGIGPTEDDLTREALAAAMGVGLVEDPEAIRALEAFFKHRGRPMPARNRVQALHPEGSRTIRNTCGTAPGIEATLGRARVFVTPGVPHEMRTMYDCDIEPALLKLPGRRPLTILTTKVNTFGWGESNVAERLGADLMDRARNPKVGTTVADGIVSVRVRSEFETPEEAHRQLDETLEQVHERLGAIVFGREEATLQASVVALLSARGLRLATAESCTGGLIGRMVTDVAGSSAVYVGGFVVYSNELKRTLLGVPPDVLEAHGAVSEPVVRRLAENALSQTGADVALSVSGIAGPGGGTQAKPVGTVYIGLAVREGSSAAAASTQTFLLRLPGGGGGTGAREAIRDRAAKSALQILRLHLLGQPLTTLQWTVLEPAAK